MPRKRAVKQTLAEHVDEVYVTLQPGEPCSHPSCLSHVTHPCKNCGRIAGQQKKVAKVEELKDLPPGVYEVQGEAAEELVRQSVELTLGSGPTDKYLMSTGSCTCHRSETSLGY